VLWQIGSASNSSTARRSTIEPDRHTRLETGRITHQIEAQAQSAPVVIPDRTLSLPSRKRASGRSSVNQSWHLLDSA